MFRQTQFELIQQELVFPLRLSMSGQDQVWPVLLWGLFCVARLYKPVGQNEFPTELDCAGFAIPRRFFFPELMAG